MTTPTSAGIPARPRHLPAARLSDNARTILAKRYLLKDEEQQPLEQAEDLFWRVAWTIASAGDGSPDDVMRTAEGFYDLMAGGWFMPNSPTLMNAGRPLGQLSACFVLPVDDALSNGKSGIYDTLRSMALVHQSGGGTGFSFSRLRATGATVRSTMGVASGPVSFMKLYDKSTDVVKQGGTRRGANMGILRVDHPDIRDFIQCKADTSQITNFNISVAVTDAFMEAVRAKEKYDLIDPRTGRVVGQEDAAEIFELIIDGAWSTGEPGMFYIDRTNQFNPVPHLGLYEACNPCGEQALLPYDVCNLGSINLGQFVVRDRGGKPTVDWERLENVIVLAVEFLDNVIDANAYPLPEIHELAQRIRRIGLGVMGWADMLVRLGIPYNSEDGVAFGREMAAFLEKHSREASSVLASNRGVFPEWGKSTFGPDETCARGADGERVHPFMPVRNCNITTVAPTGTISIIAGCSGGIEPLFAVAFMRNQAGARMPDVNEDFVVLAKEQGWYSDELMARIAESGHVHHPEVPTSVQQIFATAHDITPEWHVRMQAAFQEHTDSAISKTTNFPNNATKADVREIYELAFDLGCKGVTVYRDGCRPKQVFSTGATTSTPASDSERQEVADLRGENQRLREQLDEVKESLRAAVRVPARRDKKTRPQMLSGRTIRMQSPLGEMYVTVNEDDQGRPFEVFCTLGKAGGAANADAEALGRLISLSLRSGVGITAVRDQLRGIACDRPVGLGPNKVLSAPDAVAQALRLYEEEKEGVQQELLPMTPPPVHVGSGGGTAPDLFHQERAVNSLDTCPDCAAGTLSYEEGCLKCHVCGFSACGG